ncbi:hypothetical protein [Rubellimicrobium arenae]|uniref:hypothetical protein n=1 Tax=Rubellimicrobium arenae TaxID=2817372 RepID=UPI001B317ABB|nr:hypothetical protein [Rubellimicrobium arenae]
MKPVLILTLGLLAAPALAQSTDEEATRANALITPMLQELAPGYHGQVLAACVVAHATPEERSAMASAPGPSQEIGSIVTNVLARQETIGCVEATLKQ